MTTPHPIKAVWFDFMGTCLDWHSSIVTALPAAIPGPRKSTFALEWRQAYFDANTKRIEAGQSVEDFDLTQRRVLGDFLEDPGNADIKHHFSSPETRDGLVAAWHRQRAWPDVAAALSKLKMEQDLEIYIHANGSTRLQLDLVKSAGVQFDMLFSSELLGCYKPAPESYQKAMSLLKLKPEAVVMVAAHTSDLKGAKAVGMQTVYVYRWTDDIREDQDLIRRENDVYLDDMQSLDAVIARLNGSSIT